MLHDDSVLVPSFSIGAVGQALALDVDEEHRQTFRATLDLLHLGGAGNDQHFLRRFDAGNPDFAPIEPPAIAVAGGERLDLQAVGAGVGLGQRHAAIDFAGDDLRQQFFLHFWRAELGDRNAAEDRIDHEKLADGRAAAAGRQGFHDQRHLQHAEAGAAIFLGQRDAAQTGLAHGRPEFARESFLGVEFAPVVEPKAVADLARGFRDHLLLVGQ